MGNLQGISPENMALYGTFTYLHVLDPEDLPLKRGVLKFGDVILFLS